MCDPVSMTIAAVTATAAGAYMNHQSAKSNNLHAIQAANTQTAQNIQKTDNVQQAATQVFNDTIKPYAAQPPLDTVAPQQQANANVLQGNVPPAQVLSSGAITPNAPQVVQDSLNSDVASRIAKITASNAALGNLTGFDTTNQNAGRTLADAGSKVGTLDAFGNQDASIGSALTGQKVANSQKAPSPFGDILTGIGQIGSFGAGRGWFDGTPVIGPPTLPGLPPLPTPKMPTTSIFG